MHKRKSDDATGDVAPKSTKVPKTMKDAIGDMGANDPRKGGLRVRTVTVFFCLRHESTSAQIQLEVARATAFGKSMVSTIETETGIGVQSMRLATNPFEEYLDVSDGMASCGDRLKVTTGALRLLVVRTGAVPLAC